AVTILRSPFLMSEAFPTSHSAISSYSSEKVTEKYRRAGRWATARGMAARMAGALIPAHAAAMLGASRKGQSLLQADGEGGMRLKSLAALAAIAGALLGPGAGALAQDYPTRQVKIVIAFSPSGAIDILGRFIADKLSQMWGQSVIVENRPG